MKIRVLYNRVRALPFGRPEEVLADEDTVITARNIAENLVNLGHDVELFEVNKRTIKYLGKKQTEFFFNLAEGIGNIPDTEAEVISALEKTGMPFSGSGSQTLILTTDKAETKKLLLENKLPTPRFQVMDVGDKLDSNLHFPVVIKPIAKDGSVGINGHSVLKTADEIYDQVDFLAKTYEEPALVEEYIDGRELNVTVLGNGEKAEILPISEIVFGPSFKHKYKMVNFEAKWEEKTLAYKETNGICPAVLESKIEQEIRRISLEAIRIVNCRDYSRVDLRLSFDNKPYILEINANPGLALDSGVIRSAKAAGYTYPQFLQKIIDVALARFQ